LLNTRGTGFSGELHLRERDGRDQETEKGDEPQTAHPPK
jgi:hypothetical protein